MSLERRGLEYLIVLKKDVAVPSMAHIDQRSQYISLNGVGCKVVIAVDQLHCDCRL